MIKNEKGQVLIIILLVMGISLTIGVTLSQRAINSLKNTSSLERTNECLIHAESGVEDALQKLNVISLTNFPFCNENTLIGGWDDTTTPDSSITVCDVDASTCGDGTNLSDEAYDFAYCIWQINAYFDRHDIDKDKPFFIHIREVPTTETARIHWNGSAILDVMLVGVNNTTGEPPEVLSTMYYDPVSADGCDLGGANTATSQVSTLVASGRYVDIDLSGFPNHDNLYLRLKYLCADVDHSILEALNATQTRVDLPKQYFQINSVCLNQPVVREVQAIKDDLSISGFLDFAIYSGSSSVQLKP